MGFWSKPLGDALDNSAAKKSDAKRYQPTLFGSMKTGYIELKRDGSMIYRDNADNLKPTHFHANDVKSVEIEDATDLERRFSALRTGGGAIAGGILLGPLGLLGGAALGAIAKKRQGGEKFLVLELTDDRTVFAQVAAKHVMKAHELRNQLRS